jgi:electron transport complex protein RnfG
LHGGGGGEKRTLPQAVAAPTGVPTTKLLAVLGASGAVAGALVVVAFQLTAPPIAAHKAEVLARAVEEVLKAPHRYDTLYVYQGALTARLPAGVEARGLERVFLGYNESGERVGFAISGAEPGFQDIIELIFGYDAATHTLLGMKILSNRETPGLGDKIEKDERFVAEFSGPQTPLVGVKAGRATGAANEIDMITGATISSRAVIGIINRKLERLGPLLEAYGGEGG